MPAPRFRPRVEELDARLAPAVFTIANGDNAALIAAVNTANTNGQADEIRLATNGTYTFATPDHTDGTGPSALPAVLADGGNALTITGNGATLTRDPAAPEFRILQNAGGTLSLDRLTIANGFTPQSGGGVINQAGGTLTLNRVTAARNATLTGVGAGVFNEAGATIAAVTDCTFVENTSATFGGGIRNLGHIVRVEGTTFLNNRAIADGGGGLCNFDGSVTDLVVNCTFVGNRGVRGGGICNRAVISVVNCTFVGNTADQADGGGAIRNDFVVMALINSVMTGNIANGVPNDIGGAGDIPVKSNNVIGGDAKLGPLADNGGPTLTVKPLPGSPVLRAGTTVGAPATDQRGRPRPAGGPIDIGAVQVSIPAVVVVGADAGGGPRVQLFDEGSGTPRLDFFAFDPSFRGGVRVAAADVTGDGFPDLIAGAGSGGGPNVKVFDGKTGVLVSSFFAYEATFSGGVFVAGGDLDGDGKAEVITGTGDGGGPVVKVFDGTTGAAKLAFLAYDAAFRGGVRVAAADVSGTGIADILTTPGIGGGPNAKVFAGATAALKLSFLAGDAALRTGLFVAGGDLDGDGKAEIVTGTGGTGTTVVVSNGTTGALRGSFTTPAANVRVAVVPGSQILTAFGPGSPPDVAGFDGVTFVRDYTLAVLNPGYRGGLFVG